MKQSGSDVHVCKLAFEHVDNVLKTGFKCVWFLHFTVTYLNVASSGHFMFSGDLAKFAVTFVDVDIFLLKFRDLCAIRHYIVGVEFVCCLPELWKCIHCFTYCPDTHTVETFNLLQTICNSLEKFPSRIPTVHVKLDLSVNSIVVKHE